MGIPHSLFEEKLEALKAAKGVKQDTDLTAADLKELVAQYKDVYTEAKGEQFPSGKLLMKSSNHNRIDIKIELNHLCRPKEAVVPGGACRLRFVGQPEGEEV